MKKSNSLEIIFENEQILAADKPSGLLSVADRWDKKIETLQGLVQSYLGKEAWPVHRLDKDASGIIIFAKDQDTRTFLESQFQARTVKKIYHVLSHGEIDEHAGSIEMPLSVLPSDPGKMKVGGKGAKEALTQFEVLERFRGITYLKVMPLTGRQHQIRVHLQAFGLPVLCDPIYGSARPYYLSEMKRNYKWKKDEPEKPLLNRLALHAHQITFKTPAGETLTIESPMPKEFIVFMKYLKKFWY